MPLNQGADGLFMLVACQVDQRPVVKVRNVLPDCPRNHIGVLHVVRLSLAAGGTGGQI